MQFQSLDAGEYIFKISDKLPIGSVGGIITFDGCVISGNFIYGAIQINGAESKIEILGKLIGGRKLNAVIDLQSILRQVGKWIWQW